MDATDAEVEEAASLADIHDTILSFPDKVDILNTFLWFPFLSFDILNTLLPPFLSFVPDPNMRLLPSRFTTICKTMSSKLCLKQQGLVYEYFSALVYNGVFQDWALIVLNKGVCPG